MLFVLETVYAEPWRIIADNEHNLKSYLTSEGYNVGNIVDGKIAIQHKSHVAWAVTDIANVYWIQYV